MTIITTLAAIITVLAIQGFMFEERSVSSVSLSGYDGDSAAGVADSIMRQPPAGCKRLLGGLSSGLSLSLPS